MVARASCFLVSLALCLVGPVAGARAFSDVFFFGDSFTDTGNNGPVDANPVLVSTYGYDPDRWTNAGGTLWSEGFAAALGFAAAATASSDGGNNYAVGGARADELYGVGGQIASYASDAGGAADPDALYVVWAAGNDLLQGQDAASTVTDVMAAISELSVLGAQYILVGNLVDLSPLAPGTGPLAGVYPIPAGADVWTSDFNAGLASALAGVTGPTIYSFDLAGLIDPVIADPVGNGFSQGLAPCSTDANCVLGVGTEDFLMQDHIHFTSATHDLIAVGAVAAVPEPATAAQLALGLVVLCGTRRRRRAAPAR